jgi:hypothetical protein
MSKSNSILLIDPSFDPAAASQCDLLVKVGIDSLSYAIINKDSRAISAVYDEQECESGIIKLSERLKTDNYLTLAYRKVKIALHTSNTIDIPNLFFSEEQLIAHTQYFDEPHAEKLYTYAQAYFGFTTIFALPINTAEALSNFKGRKYPGMAGLLSIAENIAGIALMFDFTVGTFTALYLKDKQVIFQRGYEIANIEEFNYYLLLMVSQLKIQLAETTVHLTGIVHVDDEKYHCLQKYFTNIEFIPVQNSLNQQVLDDMPLYYYSSLIALDQCE